VRFIPAGKGVYCLMLFYLLVLLAKMYIVKVDWIEFFNQFNNIKLLIATYEGCANFHQIKVIKLMI